MLVITFRDERILIDLVPGACSFARLFSANWIYFTSESALRQRLAELQKNNYIESNLYVDNTTGKKFALYVLGPAGSNWLIENRRAEAWEIRTLLPSAHTVSHELVVVEIVRRLRKERWKWHYKLEYYDDPGCKKYKKVLGLKGPVPDLLCDLQMYSKEANLNRRSRISFEVHDTTPVVAVVDKALKHENQTIYLCNTQDKIRDLRAAMKARSELEGLVYFALCGEFCEAAGGIFGTNFRNWRGQMISLYPEGDVK